MVSCSKCKIGVMLPRMYTGLSVKASWLQCSMCGYETNRKVMKNG